MFKNMVFILNTTRFPDTSPWRIFYIKHYTLFLTFFFVQRQTKSMYILNSLI